MASFGRPFKVMVTFLITTRELLVLLLRQSILQIPHRPQPLRSRGERSSLPPGLKLLTQAVWYPPLGVLHIAAKSTYRATRLASVIVS